MRFLVLLRLTTSSAEDFAHLVARVHDRSGLALLGQAEHYAVLAESGSPRLELPNASGWIFGTLFDRQRNIHIDAICPEVALVIQQSHGQSLITDFWGSYFAILPRPSAVTLLRDPMGQVPGYYLEAPGVLAMASDVDVLLETELLRPALDPSYIARHLRAISLRPPRTAFIGLTELLRGERLTITDGRPAFDSAWTPWRFAECARDEPRGWQVTDLRDAAIHCAGAWSGRHSRILLDLSGGLDSSIVAACLSSAGARFDCLSFRTSQASGDERHFAHAVADHLGVRCFDLSLDLADVDLTRSFAAHLPRPTARSFTQAWDAAALRVAAGTGADGFFNGAGGDNVFCSLQSVAPVADRLRVDGIGKGAIQTALDVSALTGCSFLTAFTHGIRRAYFMPPGYRWRSVDMFLPKEAREPFIEPNVHPWLQVPDRGLIGSAAHIAMLLQIENHLEAFERASAGAMRFPLLSQPLVETCLRIPSWNWCRDGLNRNVAREAFSRLLPKMLITRRDKGRPESFLVDLFESRREEIRAMLGSGVLARAGLIDIGAICAALDDPAPSRGLAYSRILRIVDVEAWLQHWSRRGVGFG